MLVLNIVYVRQSIIANWSALCIRCSALLCSGVKWKFRGLSILL